MTIIYVLLTGLITFVLVLRLGMRWARRGR